MTGTYLSREDSTPSNGVPVPLMHAIRKVLDAFDEGVFVRNIEHDNAPDWAIRLFPYIQALSVLSDAVRPLDHCATRQGEGR